MVHGAFQTGVVMDGMGSDRIRLDGWQTHKIDFESIVTIDVVYKLARRKTLTILMKPS